LTVLADADRDGLPDGWESAYGFSATNRRDAMLDNDGDGATNAEEYAAGTDPHDPQSYLRLDCVRTVDPNVWSIRFIAVSNRTYTLQAREGFSPGGAWSPTADVVAAPTSRAVEIIQQHGDSTNQQFFRLLTPRPIERQ
jgi:hypothetical protein